MYTYAYFAGVLSANIFSIALNEMAKNESITGSPPLRGKTKPTQRFVLESYSTLHIMRVASSPTVTILVVLCLAM